MKTSFIQIFDKKPDAIKALGTITTAFPSHTHQLLDTANQAQVWTNVAGVSDAKLYGAPNPAPIYLVLSIAP